MIKVLTILLVFDSDYWQETSLWLSQGRRYWITHCYKQESIMIVWRKAWYPKQYLSSCTPVLLLQNNKSASIHYLVTWVTWASATLPLGSCIKLKSKFTRKMTTLKNSTALRSDSQGLVWRPSDQCSLGLLPKWAARQTSHSNFGT